MAPRPRSTSRAPSTRSTSRSLRSATGRSGSGTRSHSVSGAVAVQALVTGLATGAAYGLIALGFTLVHRLTRVLAFAPGDIVIGAVFVAVLAVIGTAPVAAPLGLGSALALAVIALAAGAVLSVAVYALALRPFL